MVMADHVEARSLASLNFQAANPPQYPSNPTEQRQDPLTLYISRVPGSRDIILSTLKPQLKNVTVEDVASSLYYVHYNDPEDELLVPSANHDSPRSSSERPRTPIQRKPLPANNNVPPSLMTDVSDAQSHQPPPVPLHGIPYESQAHDLPPLQPVEPVPARLDVPPHASRGPSAPASPVGDIPRKPVPGSANFSKELPPVPPHEYHPHEIPPPFPPRPTDFAGTQQPDTLQAPRPSSRSPSPSKRPFTPFSLTLIRRDPSSSQQWNVGQITSMQLTEDPDHLFDEKQKEPAPLINVHIENSGYAKFRGMPTRPSVGSIDFPPSLDPRPRSSGNNSLAAGLVENPLAGNTGGFERQVVMMYSPSFAANIRNVFARRSSRDMGDTSAASGTRVGRARGASIASMASAALDGENGENALLTQPGPGLKPRGYMFTSPWDGRCEFQTGNAGRSLRCRHFLPQLGGNVFNPLANDEGGSSKNRDSRDISELRFNLPTSEIFNKDRKPIDIGGERARDQIQSQFNKILHSRNRSQTSGEDDDEDDLYYDMTLGREKAGGGLRGKRAKMGKLIIAEDGLKMLDLVVAANVGVWWTVWERNS